MPNLLFDQIEVVEQPLTRRRDAAFGLDRLGQQPAGIGNTSSFSANRGSSRSGPCSRVSWCDRPESRRAVPSDRRCTVPPAAVLANARLPREASPAQCSIASPKVSKHQGILLPIMTTPRRMRIRIGSVTSNHLISAGFFQRACAWMERPRATPSISHYRRALAQSGELRKFCFAFHEMHSGPAFVAITNMRGAAQRFQPFPALHAVTVQMALDCDVHRTVSRVNRSPGHRVHTGGRQVRTRCTS